MRVNLTRYCEEEPGSIRVVKINTSFIVIVIILPRTQCYLLKKLVVLLSLAQRTSVDGAVPVER